MGESLCNIGHAGDAEFILGKAVENYWKVLKKAKKGQKRVEKDQKVSFVQ